MSEIELSKWVEKWTKLVEELRKGYDYYLEEYENARDVRALIQRGIAGASPTTLKIIADADHQFMELTYVDQGRQARPGEWWDNRLPLNPGHALRQDLGLD